MKKEQEKSILCNEYSINCKIESETENVVLVKGFINLVVVC